MARHACCAKVFDELKFSKFAFGTSVVLRDVIQKTEDSRHIVVTKNTKVFVTSKVACPDAHITEGQAIVNPPPADVEGAKRTVKVCGEDVDIRVVTLEENQVRAKVTLWRDATELTVKAGDYVSITDVVVNMFKGEASLSSTSRSKVEEEEERTVKTQGQDTQIKALIVEDASGRASVTMWRNQINRDVRPGNYIEMTDLVVSTYKNSTTFSTTAGSTVTNEQQTWMSGKRHYPTTNIMIQQKLMYNLKPGDAVMVYRVFNVAMELKKNRVKLLNPDFKGRDRDRSSQQEDKRSEYISKARIHVERLIQRIKTVHFLERSVCLNMLNNITQVFI
ncbi:hypothetical protein MAR_032362, partial [Mya arenaria]